MNVLRFISVRFATRAALCAVIVLALIASVQAAPKTKYWVYFKDKTPKTSLEAALQYVSPRALARRAKNMGAAEIAKSSPQNLVDFQDLPLNPIYLDRVTSLGGEIVHSVRFLNAASVMLSSTEHDVVAALPFVADVIPVRKAIVKNSDTKSVRPARTFGSGSGTQPVDDPEYGYALEQDTTIHSTELHGMGITGHGVLVGMLDSGFRWRAVDALKTRTVVAEHDFIFNDDDTADQPGQDESDQDFHGTLTMSVLGGYDPGNFLGAAYNVEFILGKTEYIPSETEIEEDHWAAGIEWMENYGADVVSSSLGYDCFDDGFCWTFQHGDFNGRTTVSAQAAVRAARMGVVVSDAAGNAGNGDGVTGTLLTPADADSILTCGAMTFDYQLAYFSSTGPTNDGRIKPDIVAPGVGVYFASTAGGYDFEQGTSLATPLVGGSAALILSARPELTVMQVIHAIKATADSVDTPPFPPLPNNFFGWGLVNAFHAALNFGPIFSNEPAVISVPSGMQISSKVVSKYGLRPNAVTLYYTASNSSSWNSQPMQLDSSMYFPTSGKYAATLPRMNFGTQVSFYIEAKDSAGNSYQSPAPILKTTWQLTYGTPAVTTPPTAPFALLQNYPNPIVNSITQIPFKAAPDARVDISVFDVLGRHIKTLYSGFAASGPNPLTWDGKNERGITVASGAYFARMKSSTQESAVRMMVVH